MGFVKIAILTMFTGLSSTYSLVNVVADQIDMQSVTSIFVKTARKDESSGLQA